MSATDSPRPGARLRVLGTTGLADAAGRSADAILAQPKRLALLAYLRLARPAGFRRREELLALFWPELDDRRARSALSQALHRIRQALGPEVVVARGPEEVGVDPAVLACDVAELDEALAEGRIADALALYDGELLPAISVADAPGFQDWLDGERVAIRERVTVAVRDAAVCAEREGRVTDAVRLARQLLELAPYDEADLRRTMTLLAATGDRAGAIRCHDEFADRMRRDLELEPGPETEALVARLRAPRAPSRPVDAVPAALPALPEAVRDASAPEPSGVEAPAAVRLRTVAWASLAVAVIACILLTWRWAVPRSAARTDDAQRVLVLPFTVRGDSGLAYLADGMVELLSAGIEGLADVHAVDPHAVMAIVGDSAAQLTPESSAAMARRLGAGTFVRGEVIALAGGIEAIGVLYDTAGRRVATFSARAPAVAQLPAAIDALARQVAASRLSGPGARLARVASVTTDSLEALRAYLAGEREQRRGAFSAAVDAYRHAVQVDSLFALAWFRLAVALEWVQPNAGERRAAMERALALGARLTERDRMLVRAAHAYSYGSLDDAESLYRQLVTAYPEDVEAWYGLAEVLFHGGPFRGRPIAQAEPAFRRLLVLSPEHFEGRLHLLRLLARHDGEVNVAEIDSLVVTSRPLVGSQPMSLLRLDAISAFVHDGAAEMREVEAAIAQLPENVAWEFGAGLATTTGNLAGAERIFRALALPARPAQWRAIARMSLANLAVAEGRWGDARRELEAASREDPTLGLFAFASLATAPWLPLTPAERDSLRRELAGWRTPVPGAALTGALPQFAVLLPAVRLLDLAELSALLGDSVAAQAYADSLGRLGPLASPIPATWALAADARAAVALATNRAGEAMAALDGGRPTPMLQSFPRAFVVTHGRERWTRAEALVAASRLREAQDWYGTFTCYLCLTDVPYEAPGWLRQARIVEELGEREAARAAYGRVLERWRSADDRFARMAAEARAGLARTASPR